MKFNLDSVLGITLALALTPAAPASADTNEWLKPSSGYWEEPYWSLGRLPASQDAVLFDNSGFKHLLSVKTR